MQSKQQQSTTQSSQQSFDDRHQEETLQKLAKQAFIEADTDKSGLIDKDELVIVMDKILGQLGIEGTNNKEIADIMFHYDVSKTGELSYEDFSVFIHDIFQAEQHPDSLEDCLIIKRIVAANISPQEMKKKQLEMVLNASENLNADFEQMMKEINEAKEQANGSNQPKRRLTEWADKTNQQYKQRRQTQVQFQTRLMSDAQYLQQCQVRRNGSVVTVSTSMGPQ